MRNNTSRILAGGHEISNDTWATGLNNNDLIIGPSGAGKTRGYVIPNILQCNESIIVADTKSRLRQDLGPTLEKEGYRVIGIDFTDCRHSWGYNPLDYIRFDEERGTYNEQDIMTAAACMTPASFTKDPYWDISARMLLECMVSYVLEYLPPEEHHMGSVVKLFMEMESGRYGKLFAELDEVDPDGFPANRHHLANSVTKADTTSACIRGVLASHISTLAFDGAMALYQNPQKVRFTDLGREKTAVFLNISDTDRSMDRLANLFYTQALHYLCDSADKDYPGHRLPVPVRFILDDFSANVCIPDFDKIISVIRSREISVSIIIQSLSQLESLYGHTRAMTILNNCDNCLYLGGQDVETAHYISVKANKSAQTILNLPLAQALLFTRGTAPQIVQKYAPEQHPRYPARSGRGAGKEVISPAGEHSGAESVERA